MASTASPFPHHHYHHHQHQCHFNTPQRSINATATPLPPYVDLELTLSAPLQPPDRRLALQLLRHPVFTSHPLPPLPSALLEPNLPPSRPRDTAATGPATNTRPQTFSTLTAVATTNISTAEPPSTDTITAIFEATQRQLRFELVYMVCFQVKCESEAITTIAEDGLYQYIEYMMGK
jgi:hypothetical protein